MKRSSFLAVVAALLILAALIFTIQPSLASRKTTQDTPIAQADVAPAAVAASSPIFSYQGQLTNASGNPITNASLPMTFRLFTALTGGTACWSENQTVNVQNGLFNVLLGQVTSIPSNCVAGTTYLELIVNGETLAPRELLASVASAVNAQTLVDGATASGSFTVSGLLTVNNEGTSFISGNLRVGGNGAASYAGMNGNDLVVDGTFEQIGGEGARIYRLGIGRNPGGGEGDMHVGNALAVGNYLDMTEGNLNNVNTINYTGTEIAKSNTAMRMISNGTSFRVFLDADNNEDGANFQVYRDAPNFNGAQKLLFDVDQNGNVLLIGSLTSSPNSNLRIDAGAGTSNTVEIMDGLLIYGDCQRASALGHDSEIVQVGDSRSDCEAGSITSGAYIEANLMTADERADNAIPRFERGDLLCWSADEQQLALCVAANDRLVMAVANADGKPIVLGAEPIKVIGPVVAGDLLVASGVPGHAMVNNDPLPGTVIGQALEDLDGESGMIKAMIRKW